MNFLAAPFGSEEWAIANSGARDVDYIIGEKNVPQLIGHRSADHIDWKYLEVLEGLEWRRNGNQGFTEGFTDIIAGRRSVSDWGCTGASLARPGRRTKPTEISDCSGQRAKAELTRLLSRQDRGGTWWLR